jgi:hypothetical protein
VTAELKFPVPVTVAEHFEVWFTAMEFGEQETVTEVIVGGGRLSPLPPPPPPQDVNAKNRITHRKQHKTTQSERIHTPPEDNSRSLRGTSILDLRPDR